MNTTFAEKTSALRWLRTGREIFRAIQEALPEARSSIDLETYYFSDGPLGREILAALLAAAQRGVRVRVLVDAVGSWLLPGDFFKPLMAAGGEVRVFNPLHLWRFGVRDHRKLLVCDRAVVFVGGFNIADEYNGDGVTSGWYDLGVRLENPVLAGELTASFEKLFALAEFSSRPVLRLRPFRGLHKRTQIPAGELLAIQPGHGASPFQTALARDLGQAREVRIICAYFLPTRRLRRLLLGMVRRGGRVQLLLPGKSDVPPSQMAAQSLYLRLLKAGVEIYEYQPRMLHAKLICVDRITYVGSSNLDTRSLNLNYELMLRFPDPATAAGAREIFADALVRSRKIELAEWRASQTLWQRTKNHWAHFLLSRVDPLVALWQLRVMKK